MSNCCACHLYVIPLATKVNPEMTLVFICAVQAVNYNICFQLLFHNAGRSCLSKQEISYSGVRVNLHKV